MFTGIRQFELKEAQTAEPLPMMAMYPTLTPPGSVKLGPHTESLSPNAPIAAGKHLPIVMSSGGEGSHLAYRSLASHLASNGCIVAMPDPGKDRNDQRLEGTLEKLKARPRCVTLCLDALATDAMFAPHVARDTAAAIGCSTGGYTALAAGSADERVKAVVLISPATPWFFAEGALAGVKVPVRMFTAEAESCGPPWYAEVLKRGLPDAALLTHRQVSGASTGDLSEQILSFIRDAFARVRAA